MLFLSITTLLGYGLPLRCVYWSLGGSDSTVSEVSLTVTFTQALKSKCCRVSSSAYQVFMWPVQVLCPFKNWGLFVLLLSAVIALHCVI